MSPLIGLPVVLESLAVSLCSTRAVLVAIHPVAKVSSLFLDMCSNY
jgi:hypothetical protein